MNFLPIAVHFIVLDIITAWGIKRTFPQFASRYQRRIRYSIFIQSVVSVLILVFGYYFDRQIINYRLIALFYYIFGVLLVVYLPKTIFALFLFIDLFFAMFSKLYRRWFDIFPRGPRRIIAKCGIWTSAVFACVIVWGILFGRNNISVDHVEIFIDDLPSAFNGYRIVQISDLHAGSFWSTEHFQKAVDLINQQEPNLIVCTGDMVNNFAEEIVPLIPVFEQLKASDGKYAILGNHDYGGYYDWKHPDDSIANHHAFKAAIEQMGFVLLINQSEIIYRYNSDCMALIGVENWGKEKRFPKRAKLDKVMEPIQDISFKVLLTHNPIFWPYFVVENTDIVLTLSGHTHGMQMGVKLGKKRYSFASRTVFRFQTGLHQINKQYLYVNRGLGVIGFPGRIGMPPEITVINLWKTKPPEQQ